MKKIFLVLITAFCFNANAQFTKLLEFNNTNGSQPYGSAILSANDSVLYGMTNSGKIYSINIDGSGLNEFTLTNIGTPYGSLIRSGDTLYGMGSGGGAYGLGGIFSIHTDLTGYTDIYDFTGDSASVDSALGGSHSGGANPNGTLTIVGNVLYGMTYGAGGPDVGNIFSINIDGTGYKSLHDFTGIDGEHPGYGALTISGNTMYGTTLYGGTSGTGVLFSMQTDGSGYTKVIDFNSANGSAPFGSVLLCGNTLFGVADGGGLYSKGLIYSIHTDGTGYKDLFDFDGANGLGPMGSLQIHGTTLYGTTGGGGTNNLGTIFSIDTSGTGFQNLFNFNTPNGTQPRATLSISGNMLYGTCVVGGAYGSGTVFSFKDLPLAPAICMVTTDSATNYNYNKIVWDKTPYNNVDSFIVYRYDVMSSSYLRIGAVSKNSLSEFVDTAFSIGGPNGGNPLYSSWQYKLAIRDTMGNIGAKSPYHQSMFVQESGATFSWNAYTIEGSSSPVTGYSFLRDDNNTGNWHVLVNTAGLSSTDPNYASYPNSNWRVDALGFNCTPTLRMGNNNTASLNKKSHSNTSKPTNVGIGQSLNNNTVSVFPNPASNNIIIRSSGEPGSILIYNTLGEIVFRARCKQANEEIDISALPAGVYTIQARGKMIKLIKE